MEIAALLERRERIQLTPQEVEVDDEQLRRAVLTLWQTNLLRRTKLTVLDEVANGLSFYDYTFLHEVPQLHCTLEDRLNEGDSAAGELASFLRVGSWIGGDRDGNPFVTAEVMRGTLKMQSSRVLRFYLEELHALGAELSLAAHLADVSTRICARLPSARPTPRRTGAASRIDWRYPAFTPVSPLPPRGWMWKPCGRRSAPRRPTPMSRSSRPISMCSIVR